MKLKLSVGEKRMLRDIGRSGARRRRRPARRLARPASGCRLTRLRARPLRDLNSRAGYPSGRWTSAFKDGRAIVLGASQGMGLAIAEGLAADGAGVAMFARRADVVEREAARIGGLAVPGDLTVLADLDRLVAATVEAFGGIDIVVLNGGGPSPRLRRRLSRRMRSRRQSISSSSRTSTSSGCACRTCAHKGVAGSSRSSRRR